MIIESGPDFRYSQLGSLLGGYSVKCKRKGRNRQKLECHVMKEEEEEERRG